jgi:hypothetical protein
MSKPENRRVAGQIGRSMTGVCWHGPSVVETLAGVTAEKAAAHAGPEVHSIWELVKHINGWQQVALRTLAGDQYVSLADDEDWPPVTVTSEDDWLRDLESLRNVNLQLVEAVRAFPEDRLEELVPGRESNFYFLLHGIVQHNIYHAGQIAMLKKLV